MPNELYFNTVTPTLSNALSKLMEEEVFSPFRLVGGTSLSLRFGHRVSDDIDLFTDAPYGSLDFNVLENKLKQLFPYYDCSDTSGIVGFGRMYYVGLNVDYLVKLDLFYTDPFFDAAQVINGIRFASVEQIAAMKMQAIDTGGRKKDWWDIDLLLEYYSLSELLAFHEKWQPYTHNTESLLEKLTDFSKADDYPDPRCLRNKDWNRIKLNIIRHVKNISPAR